MKKLRVLSCLFCLIGCEPSASTVHRTAAARSEEILLHRSLDAPELKEGEATALNVSKKDIQFPIWWVQQGFEQGNSPKVIVFFTDGRIYGRHERGGKLNPLGIWAYDPSYRRIFTSLGPENNLTLGLADDGSWDGRIYFRQTELTKGSADFTSDNLSGVYRSSTDNAENIYQNFFYTSNRSKIMALYGINFLPNGTLKFAGVVEGNIRDLEFLWTENEEMVLSKWRISPLGDAVELYESSEFCNGLMLEAKYEGSEAHSDIVIRAFSHAQFPVYKQSQRMEITNSEVQIVKNLGGQALMRPLK